MKSLIISFILTFNTLFVLAASFPGGWGWQHDRPPVNAKTFSQCMSRVPTFDYYSRTTKYDLVPFSDFYAAKVNETSYTSVLNSTAQNFRCLESSISKPIIIFRPTNESHVRPAVLCARLYDLNIRIRSGGHDYEGISYISLMNQQFMILDLYNLRDVDIDTGSETAWVQAGATNGELYYKISQVSHKLAFPAGLCSSLGIGGHLTGGAYGSMMRKFGLGADNVLDVRMVDAWGFVRSKEFRNLNDDLFWALTGGGGGNFGVILAWKIKLVNIPSKVTMFTAVKTLQDKGTDTLYQWQKIAPKLPNELFIRVIIQAVPKTTVITIYQALYLGNAKTLARIMQKRFPQLGVKLVNCTEMRWIESVMAIAGFGSSDKPESLLEHKPAFQSNYFKAKSDFLRTPMSKKAMEGMFNIFMEQGSPSVMIWNPYGGMMGKIDEGATPFPHRKGVICKIQYVATWLDASPESQLKLEDWMRRLYDYMGKYVSSNPREAYVNYRDLDIGKKEGTGSNCSYPEIWGPKYYKNNFERLVQVKNQFDPFNVFKHEQSIPTSWMQKQCTDVI